jgi:hypothetical protein
MALTEGLYQAVSSGLHNEPAATELIALLRTIDVVAGTAEAGNALVLDSSGGIATIASATITSLSVNVIDGATSAVTIADITQITPDSGGLSITGSSSPILIGASGDEVGFFGATPVVQQTTVANAAGTDSAIIDAIRDALVAYGLLA